MSTTATLTWSRSPEGDVAKYNIYRKNGSAPAKPGDRLASTPQVAADPVTFVDTITVDGDYFYAVSAVDTSGNESGLSNVKDKVVDATPPQAPVLQSVV